MNTNDILGLLFNVGLGVWCLHSLFKVKFDKVTKGTMIMCMIDVVIIEDCIRSLVGMLGAMLFPKFLRKKYSLKRRNRYGIKDC